MIGLAVKNSGVRDRLDPRVAIAFEPDADTGAGQATRQIVNESHNTRPKASFLECRRNRAIYESDALCGMFLLA